MDTDYLSLSWTLFVQISVFFVNALVFWQGWAAFWFPCCLMCFLHAVISQATYMPPLTIGRLKLEWYRSRDILWEFVRMALLFAHYILMGYKIYTGVDHHGEYFELYHHWTFLESVSFIIATMSSVGYGDFTPNPNPDARRMTIFYAVLGLLVYSIVTVWLVRACSAIHRWLMELCNYRYWQPTLMQASALYVFKLYVSFCLFQLGSAWVYHRLEGWDFDSALYHTIITATTIGYGDLMIKTDFGRIWSAVHMLLSTSFLATILTFLHTLPVHFKIEMLANLKPDPDMLRELSSNGVTVTETEYLVGMLKKADLIDARALDLLIGHFNELDTSGSGLIPIVEDANCPSINEIQSKRVSGVREIKASGVLDRSSIAACVGLAYFWFGILIGYISFLCGALRLIAVMAIRGCKPEKLGVQIALCCAIVTLLLDVVNIVLTTLGFVSVGLFAMNDFNSNPSNFAWPEGSLGKEVKALLSLVLAIEVALLLCADVPLTLACWRNMKSTDWPPVTPPIESSDVPVVSTVAEDSTPSVEVLDTETHI